MKLTVNVTEDRQLIIPADALEPMHLEPGTAVEIDIKATRPHTFNQQKWDRAMARLDELRPAFQKQMLEDGYTTVDELMADLRPEW